ncbi:hypothetical protein ElyMa_006133200 [Elysia marginata]|uniref:Uncharacterized protein n=1 Tax=Elysia marginata TaxID=1093978 RepID=A0AAV4GWG7_9GAST|nr:hypothetical protein ElyMa_006133200 [Elysia marginata]
MKARWSVVVKQHLEETGETLTASNFSHLLKKVWQRCAKLEASLKGFMRSGIFPFNPLTSGKMEASRSFSSCSSKSQTYQQLLMPLHKIKHPRGSCHHRQPLHRQTLPDD